MRAVGDKVEAPRSSPKRAGVPVVPGSDGRVEDEEAAAVAERDRLPGADQGAAGGGGRGMRVVAQRASSCSTALAQARGEAEAAFGDGGVYLEKYSSSPRHVEVQILGDQHGNVVHLGERDCSLQRRHQKLVEESPAPTLPAEHARGDVRRGGAAAARPGYDSTPARSSSWSTRTSNFYFIEVNARIQVEHP